MLDEGAPQRLRSDGGGERLQRRRDGRAEATVKWLGLTHFARAERGAYQPS